MGSFIADSENEEDEEDEEEEEGLRAQILALASVLPPYGHKQVREDGRDHHTYRKGYWW